MNMFNVYLVTYAKIRIHVYRALDLRLWGQFASRRLAVDLDQSFETLDQVIK
jgi:hypothetical protein